MLNRYSPDFNLVAAKGDFGLAVRIVFLGGLGPKGDIGRLGWNSGLGLNDDMWESGNSNSGPSENVGKLSICMAAGQ